MNNGMWIKVTLYGTGRRMAVNLKNVIRVTENSREDVFRGERSTITFSDEVERSVYESFDEIVAKMEGEQDE